MSDRQQSKSEGADKDDWCTPPRVYEPLWETCGIDMDPCAGDYQTLARINIDEDQDGLTTPWEGVVYCNPPYSEKSRWIERAIDQYQNNRTVEMVFLLLPDSTDVKSWWHGQLAEHSRWTLFYEGRVKFIDPVREEQMGSPPHGSALCILGEPSPATLRRLSEEGDLVERPKFL